MNSVPASPTGLPLPQLRDIVAPATVDSYIVSPGVLVILTVLGLCLAALAVLLWRKYKSNEFRRRAIAALDTWYDDQQHAELQPEHIHFINQLLKRVALHLWPREAIAANSGQQWQTFLETAGKASIPAPVSKALATGGYRANTIVETDLSTVVHASRRWIQIAKPR
jgi:hypothetical protein